MKFSIIVRTFNRKKFILRALKSILKQTYKNYEILIIDDFSTDGTKQYLKKKLNDKRIKYFFIKKNIGHIRASEFGLNKAKGDILCFLDSDDIWDKNYLKEHFKVHKKYNQNLCVYNNTLTLINNTKTRVYYSNLEGFCYKKALVNLFISSQIALSFKKEAWKKIKKLDHKIAREDDDLCLRLSKYFLFKHIDQDLSFAYLETKQQVTSNKIKHAKDYEKLFNKYEKDIQKFCTKSQISNHFYEISKKFLICKDYKKSKFYIKKSLNNYLNLKSFLILIVLLFRKSNK
tara:strand:- start:784 stop:1647 length:864 start_codon:yes stop_codon:yes gene_type:complete